MPAASPQRAELRDFLRKCRARLSPSDVGLPSGGRRRTPGLRREEVAVLASVGESWYAWLEQGRDINVSDRVLDAIAGALRMSPLERAHLYRLAGLQPPELSRPGTVPADPRLQRVVDGWGCSPAYVIDRWWNIVVANGAARDVFALREQDHNCVVAFFTNAERRKRYPNRAEVGSAVVSQLRADAARFPDDEGFRTLVSGLLTESPEFAELWERHEVNRAHPSERVIVHPVAGKLELEQTTLAITDCQDARLVLFTALPNTDTAQALAELGQQRSNTEHSPRRVGRPVLPGRAYPAIPPCRAPHAASPTRTAVWSSRP